MKAQRVRRLFAATATGVLLAGGAVLGTAGAAPAATPQAVPAHHGCGGWWGNCGGFARNDFFGNGFRSGFGGTGVVVIVVS
ncbi:hypothetical protein ACH4NF_24715 [Streptomyces sp. NPDC017248]|uniref:hypothetical protein n=1 Tax=unclassified Streptomyces TaxID=2593676 RepID=UPI00341EB1A5